MKFMRAEVVKIHNLGGTTAPSMLFDVRPVSSNVVGTAQGGLITNVVMLQAGFGDLTKTTEPAGGIVFVPEEGSRVLCVHDGFRWAIVGCYTGPVTTQAETFADGDGQQVSYNPGIGHVVPRIDGAPAFDDVHEWSMVLQPGDAVMIKGSAQVKVGNAGLFQGANANNFSIYKRDGQRLDRAANTDTRRMGFWEVHDFGTGTDSVLAAATGPVKDVPGSYSYRCSVHEVGLFSVQLTPFLIQQRGHVSPTFLHFGRSSPNCALSPFDVISERSTGGYFVERDALIKPLIPDLPENVVVEDTKQVTLYDRTVSADGSWTTRAGNLAHVPGATTPVQDCSVSYDNKTNTWEIRVGRGGNPAATITVRGQTPLDSEVTVEAATITASALTSLKAEAKVSATVTAPKIDVTAQLAATVACGTSQLLLTPASTTILSPTIVLAGSVTISGALAVAGPITGAPGGANITTHTHTYVDTPLPTPSVTSPPNPA